ARGSALRARARTRAGSAAPAEGSRERVGRGGGRSDTDRRPEGRRAPTDGNSSHYTSIVFVCPLSSVLGVAVASEQTSIIGRGPRDATPVETKKIARCGHLFTAEIRLGISVSAAGLPARATLVENSSQG